MQILKELREEGRAEDMQALLDHIPYAKFMGVQVDRKGNEVTTILPFNEMLIGNPTLPAIHGGAIGAFLELTSVIQLLFNTQCERLPKTVDVSIDYLRSGRPVETFGRAVVTRQGRRVANVRAEIWQDEFNKPIAAPSANPSGWISPSTAKHVLDGLGGRLDLVLDGGPCESGLESTIIDCTGEVARLLRPGGITRDAMAAALAAANCNPQIDIAEPLADHENPVAPGQLASHYAPKAAVRLMAKTNTANEELIGFGTVSGAGKLSLNLSPSADLVEAAANLFSMLHAVDAANIVKIAIAPIPNTGLGEAINDRLRRAAAPR